MFDKIKSDAYIAAKELIEVAGLCKGDILVVGCSSSEIVGDTIGTASSVDAAKATFQGIMDVLKEKEIFLAAQCCEHLNRALVVEKELAKLYGIDIVNVVPQPKAGGSFATTAYACFENPVVIENVQAHAGMDIGDTLIGMHLKNVAVPVRLSIRKIGEANLVCARTRGKYIGGPRACYE